MTADGVSVDLTSSIACYNSTCFTSLTSVNGGVSGDAMDHDLSLPQLAATAIASVVYPLLNESAVENYTAFVTTTATTTTDNNNNYSSSNINNNSLPLDFQLEPPQQQQLSAAAAAAAAAAAVATVFGSTTTPTTATTTAAAVPAAASQLLRHDVAINALLCAAYALVFIVGILGNSCVVAVVHRCQRMHTATNYFIANLALADLLVLLFCLPATLLSNIFSPWIMGRFMCKAFSYVQGVSVSASINSLMAVSLDRCLAICWGLKCRISNRRARTIIALIWLVPALIMLPWPIHFDLRVHDSIVICEEVWPAHLDANLFFVLANLVFCYVLPLLVITVSYVGIWIRVSRRDIPSDTKDVQLTRIQRRSKFKVVKMLLIVVIVFTLSWLPLYTAFVLVKFFELDTLPSWLQSALPVAVPVAQWLGASNSCINPVLYAFFNKKYRLGFQALMRSTGCCAPIRIDLPADSTVRRPVNYQRHLANACQAAVGGDYKRGRCYKPTCALLATSVQIGVGVSQSGIKQLVTGV